MLSSHSQFMQLAIDKAWKYQLLTYPNPAVGATVTCKEILLSVEAHKKAGTAHAEVLALKSAYLTKYPNSELKELETSQEIHDFLIKNHNNFFHDCEIYVTLEPCNHIGKTPACAILLEVVKPKKVYIGTLDPNNEASGGLQRLQNANIDVEINISKKETDDLLYPFIQWQKDKFVFFKIAMREDGSIDGGYITTQDSLNFVHELRTKIDLMVIGGNTVRIDRPTLDSRYSESKIAPNILIYSRQKEFDKNIKLFTIKNRNVEISDNFELQNSKNFVMIEGGYKLLESIKQNIDYLVIFMSHKKNYSQKKDMNICGFEIKYSYYINENDEIFFLARK